MAATQKAYQQKESGECAFVLNDAAEKPTAGPKQVIVKNYGAGVNPIDHKATTGGFAQGRPFPVTCGIDGAGVVDSVGEGVTDFAVGEKVFYCTGLAGFGSYAQYSRADASHVFKLPAEWNLEEASTCGCVTITTALVLFQKLKIQAGEWVFINGGSGGVGCVAVQLAAFTGCKVVATCSAKNVDFVKGLGATEVVDYTSEDVVARVKEITGGAGARAVFDTVSTEPTKLIGAVAFGGDLATILPAALDGGSAFALFSSNVSLHQILVMSFMPYASAITRKSMDPVFAAIKAGKFKIPIQKKYTLDEVQAAMQNNMEGRTQGKTVIIIDESVA